MRAYVAVHTARSIRRLFATIRLVRPAFLLAVAFFVYLGGLLADGPDIFANVSSGVVSFAALSAVLGVASANVFDNLYGLESDRIEGSERLFTAGTPRSSTARVMAITLGILGVALAAVISFVHAGVAIAAAVLFHFYITRLGSRPLAGSVVVSSIAALALIYGSLHAAPNIPVWLAAGFALVLTLSSEILGDVQEVDGNAAAGGRRVAVRLDSERVRKASLGMILGALLVSPVPFLYLDYGGIYLLALIVTDAILLRAVWLLVMRPVGDVPRSIRALRWGTVTALCSLALHWVG